jgi:hypothetical protein
MRLSVLAGIVIMGSGCGGTVGIQGESALAVEGIGGGGVLRSAESLGYPGYVITPHGLVHKSCVHRVDSAAPVDPNYDPACAFAMYRHIEAAATPTSGAAAIPTTNGWVEDGNRYVDYYVQNFEGNFHVPPVPAQGGGQGPIIFLFNALEDSTGGNIIQPVLSHGCEYDRFHCQWQIASWYGGNYWGGNYYHSTPQSVNAGDTLYGRMYAHQNDCNGGCLWTIYTSSSNGAATQISVHTTLPWQWIFSGVLEVYNVDNCAQYPGGHAYFWNLHVRDWSGADRTPGYYNPWVGVTGCGQNAVWQAPFMNLYY